MRHSTIALAVNINSIATARFSNGFVAVTWTHGGYPFVYLYDTNGNQQGHQYGDRQCPFYSDWTFRVGNDEYVLQVKEFAPDFNREFGGSAK